MSARWSRKRVLIVVRTYPTPSKGSIEASCTAGVTESGEWMRIFPVPWRLLDDDKRFRKYQWVEIDVTRPRDDPRPESHKLNAETIVCGDTVSTERSWHARRHLLKPLISRCMCDLKRQRDQHGSPTLGLFKPAKIKRLLIKSTAPTWSQAEMTALRQEDLFGKTPAKQLEKIPFDFRYEFTCSDADCRGHQMICTDWELGEAYRSWRRKYGDHWEKHFRNRFETEMIQKYDTHFFVGTLHQHPANWIIIGLFYPPQQPMDDLFAHI